MEDLKTRFLVIGSGPAGQKAAMQACKLGADVIMIEKYPVLGGACLNSGTIPSKSLREAILDLGDFYEKSFYAPKLESVADKEISIKDLNFRLHRILQDEQGMLKRQFEKNEIKIIQGCASFEDNHHIIVKDKAGVTTHRIEAEFIVIASGSKPRNPINVPFDNEVILDSTRLLSIDRLPKKLIVLGAGIVGTEYASFFATLGTQVTLVDKKDRLLGWIDQEIGIHLQSALTQIGLTFVGGKNPIEIKREGDKAVVVFPDGEIMQGDMLLYALGRIADADELQLNAAGIQLTDKGFVPVNALFQTPIAHIYAVGDVIGPPALASTSMEQGRLAARNALGAPGHHFPSFFPVGIYTIPEISSCGYTEEELQALDFRYKVGRAYYSELAKSRIGGNHVGMFKILFNPETLQILGIHIIGRSATEVIHIGQVAMSFNATLDYFINQVFNYPTYAEGYRVAAFNGLNKVSHHR
jgi:NAD(P) transhydrogenase